MHETNEETVSQQFNSRSPIQGALAQIHPLKATGRKSAPAKPYARI